MPEKIDVWPKMYAYKELWSNDKTVGRMAVQGVVEVKADVYPEGEVLGVVEPYVQIEVSGRAVELFSIKEIKAVQSICKQTIDKFLSEERNVHN